MNLISRFEFEFPCSRPNTCKTNDWPINLQPITFCLVLIARVIMVTMMVNTVNITPSAFQHCHCEHDVIMTTNQMCNVCVCAVTWSQVDVTFHWVCACVILSHPPSTRCISSPPPSSSVKILTSLLHHLVSSLCSSSSLSLWKKAASVQCKLKIRVRTHTRTHTHLILWVLTTKWHTVWMLYLYVSVLCPWHFCNYLWVKKKYQNAASACEMLHRINKRGCRGPARLSDSHPDWELRGFEDESCSCIFYKPALQTICSPTRSHMHTLTHKNTIWDGRVHQGNVPLFNGTWSYMCKHTRTHTLS